MLYTILCFVMHVMLLQRSKLYLTSKFYLPKTQYYFFFCFKEQKGRGRDLSLSNSSLRTITWFYLFSARFHFLSFMRCGGFKYSKYFDSLLVKLYISVYISVCIQGIHAQKSCFLMVGSLRERGGGRNHHKLHFYLNLK